MHYPGHLRDSFLEWLNEDCPPLARVEVDHTFVTWPAERLLQRMLRCSDVMPGSVYGDTVERLGLDRSRRQTYGSIARVLLDRSNATQSPAGTQSSV